MTTITFHLPSLLVGAVVGFLSGGFVFFLTLFGERWSVGFSDGWNCGKEYGEKKREKSEEKK